MEIKLKELIESIEEDSIIFGGVKQVMNLRKN